MNLGRWISIVLIILVFWAVFAPRDTQKESREKLAELVFIRSVEKIAADNPGAGMQMVGFGYGPIVRIGPGWYVMTEQQKGEFVDSVAVAWLGTLRGVGLSEGDAKVVTVQDPAGNTVGKWSALSGLKIMR